MVMATPTLAVDLFSNMVEIDLQDSFKPMPEYVFRLKYPNLDYSQTTSYYDSSGTISIAFCHMQESASQDSIEKVRNKMQRQYTKLGVAEQCKIKEINGRKFITLEFMSKAIDADVFNLVFATDLEGRLLFATYNCSASKMNQGVDLGYRILNSVKIKE